MNPTTERLRAVVAANLSEGACRRIEQLEPRLRVVSDSRLYRPRRWPADWGGDPSHARTTGEQDDFHALVDSADVLLSIPDTDPAELARTVRSNPSLRWVHVLAAGGGAQVKESGLTADEMRSITFTTSAGIHGDALAEFAVLGVLAGAKDLPRLQTDQAASHWPDRRQMRQVADMTVLVLGLGGIGTAIAARLSAFGAEIWGASRSGRSVPGVSRIVRIDELADVVPDVDAIVVTLPGTDRTRHLLDERVFRAVKPGVIVVNVGRGSVIDEAALLTALADDVVSYAALDVFEAEPLPPGSPLWQHPRVLVSPHTAAVTEHEEQRIAELFADNARRLLDGEPLRNVVDTVEFY